LAVSRSGYYKWRSRRLSIRALRNQELLVKVKRIFDESRTAYGSPRVHAQLLREGEQTSRGRVERLMRKAGLVGKAARIYRRKSLPSVFFHSLPNLRLDIPEPDGINQQWVGDVTYLKVSGQWRYLAVVMDLYSRRIIGWKLDKHRTAEVTRDALRQALRHRKINRGLIFHTDRGSEYGAWLLQNELKRHGMLSSMNRAESVTDNAHMESFFRSMKTETTKGVEYKSEHELRMALAGYIDGFYNTKRLHSSLGYKTPIEYDRMVA
jgi:transposase InsO family protein